MTDDFRELLSAFAKHEVEYLVVGAHALAAHGHVRATEDLDVWIRADATNARRTWRALAEFGAPLADVAESDFATAGAVLQIGVAPLRIDITAIDGVEFDDAWSDRFESTFLGESVFVISKRCLIRNKRASGRTQDLADVERLESP